MNKLIEIFIIIMKFKYLYVVNFALKKLMIDIYMKVVRKL